MSVTFADKTVYGQPIVGTTIYKDQLLATLASSEATVAAKKQASALLEWYDAEVQTNPTDPGTLGFAEAQVSCVMSGVSELKTVVGNDGVKRVTIELNPDRKTSLQVPTSKQEQLPRVPLTSPGFSSACEPIVIAPSDIEQNAVAAMDFDFRFSKSEIDRRVKALTDEADRLRAMRDQKS